MKRYREFPGAFLKKGVIDRGCTPEFHRSHAWRYCGAKAVQDKCFMESCCTGGTQGRHQSGLYLTCDGRFGENDEAALFPFHLCHHDEFL
jgi:hypothetical protein